MTDLTHIGPDGRARMVNVGDKPATDRMARARGEVSVSRETFDLAAARQTKKGDPLAIAELAGIMGAKKTSELIPLCHPLPLTSVTVSVMAEAATGLLQVEAVAKTSGQTGVEMEALSAVSVACLTLYDMLKAVDKNMEIGRIRLVEKTGGQSGTFLREDEA